MAITLYMLVEGNTEERFANQVLVPHLSTVDVFAEVSKVVTRGRRGRPEAQGGGRTYRAWKNDLSTWIKQQGHRPNVWFTTMLDVYGLGAFSDGFPGFDHWNTRHDAHQGVAMLEAAWAKDIGFERFLPHLQLHEFESLLLVDVAVLKQQFVERVLDVERLATEIKDACKPPEEIDDGHNTAPSKLIARHLPQYPRQKAVAGPSAVGQIGLSRLRKACPHFGAWLETMEQLAQA